jgi:probable phosphoglycerate mutase
VAELLDAPVEEEPGFAETEFGRWDGLTLAEVDAAFPGELEKWFASMDHAPAGGESFTVVRERVLAGLDRLLQRYDGRTVVVVSHVTPIKVLIAHVLGAPLDAGFRMELAPASVSVVSFYPDEDGGAPRGSLRLYNALPPGRDALAVAATQW